ncbi:hypothetical protein Jab_1c20550 [Janthinobacterium sp. HH01]|uniref:hypothetical protein n=1 Tax=Janthinobacterium sp. HH01 TaxID=1198452 RepID=UPI0002AEAF3C|nr:hypothetical protein [Janthinobacterium sp. HH01]ELX13426.1 hypothetical protein Jab_1c20550 [Janthinobacterium sp. HH01]
MTLTLSKTTAPLALAGMLVLTLAACGGGGGGAASNASVPPAPAATSFPVQQGLAYAFTHGLQSTLTVSGSTTNGSTTYPLTGTLTYTLGAVVNAAFNGAAVQQATETLSGTISGNGTTTPLTTSSQLYVNAQYTPVGSYEAGAYCVANSTAAYPASATAGQTGDLASFSCYTDSTRRTLTSTQKITYVTTAGSDGNSLDFQMLSNVFDAANKSLGSTGTTYTISAAGIPKLTRIQLTETVGGISFTIDAK